MYRTSAVLFVANLEKPEIRPYAHQWIMAEYIKV